ncbi:hypothetical protein M413DRAFT_449985 [Hebeloma cylindrosporum]|uniref:Uncharacterized protein n=1 Tax=Hebeloma cylindrosporum TaxID=76867 RepID=A0A0C3BS92_HEBCY|nr:hypothetical protein M413DRAFT_449985 [Hebeloma cylindrosporum h7]
MVFGFFSRKPPAAAATTTTVEAGSSTANLTEQDAISPQFKFPPAPQLQLHTPSPSIDSNALLLAEKPKPKPKPRARAKPKPKPVVEPKHASPDIVPPDTPSPPPEDLTVPVVTDPTALYALISSVPAQTLHTYTLAHLSPVPPSPFPFTALSGPPPIATPTPDILTALTTFFSSLAPPPKLHCVRCHRWYFELENADTACRIPHDDDSATVERVGLTRGGDAVYETLWGCCSKTVEGDGDMGPPDGWCYEGAHTTDTKRARFRADSTPQNDKLTSCLAMRCHMPPLPPRSSRASASRKRNRRVMETDGDEHEDDARSVASSQRTHARSQSQSHSHSISIPRNTHARTRSVSSMSKGKARVCYPPEGGENEEQEEVEEPRRPAKRVRARKSSVFAGSASASRRLRKEEEEGTSSENENDDPDAMDVDNDMPPPPPPISPPRSPPKRKSKLSAKAAAAASACAASPPPRSPPRSPPNRDPKVNGRKAVPTSSASSASRGGSPTPAASMPKPASMARAMMAKRVEVEIVSRSPPKSVGVGAVSVGGGKSVSRVGSVGSLRGGRGKKEGKEKEKETEKTKLLGEIVDTSVDGEGWS